MVSEELINKIVGLLEEKIARLEVDLHLLRMENAELKAENQRLRITTSLSSLPSAMKVTG